MFRAHAHAAFGNGNERENRPKIGRNRANRPSAENGRADAARIAPVALQRPFRPETRPIGRNANRAILGASKSKSPHSTWTSGDSYEKYTHGCISTPISTAEKHERSLTLFVLIVVHLPAQSTGPPPVWTQYDRKF